MYFNLGKIITESLPRCLQDTRGRLIYDIVEVSPDRYGCAMLTSLIKNISKEYSVEGYLTDDGQQRIRYLNYKPRGATL